MIRCNISKRTARENIKRLTDNKEFFEYGDLVYAAQRSRRSLNDLIENPPADGLITGISIAANRYSHIRAALCNDVKSCELSRLHNDANILVLGGRIIEHDVALKCVDKFLSTDFEGGRHIKRIDKLSNPPLL